MVLMNANNRSDKQQVVTGVAASVDYLTITTLEPSSSADLLDLVFRMVRPKLEQWPEGRKWHFKGFRGMAYEGLRYGVRDQEAIVMVSSRMAHELWRVLAPKRHRATRIDLAVTVTLADEDTNVARRAYAKVLSDGVKNGTLISNTRGGSTLYVGSRQSQYYGRLYDKSAEEEVTPGFIWRYEVEVKKPAAECVLCALVESPDEPAWIGSYVYDWFYQRGVEPIYSRNDTDSAIEFSVDVVTPQRKLNWLRTQVRPTVGSLIVGGYEIEVIDALGLTSQVNLKEVIVLEDK